MSKVRLVVLSLLAVLAVSAVASASASATIMPAYSTITGTLKIESKKVAGSGNAKLEGTLAGVTVLIECSVEKGGGSIENTAVMGLSTATVHYTSCTVAQPAGQNCLVTNGLVLVTSHDLLVLSGTKVRDEFAPESGTTFTTINIDNCTTTALNGAFKVTGTATAETNNTASSLEFSSTSGEALKFGGNPIYLY